MKHVFQLSALLRGQFYWPFSRVSEELMYNFINFRDEMANIENRILEKKIAEKKKEELRQKNIAVMIC